ncbi:MAG: hypothetical protein AVO33_04165 [delta proteobacterium ML8_F1]|nr:MAG: hypothetical protein AVO33_04165 [delta proteobacterium ML8_F1]
MSPPITLEERVLTIKDDPGEIEALMKEYDPLIRSLVLRRTGKTSRDAMDEYNLALFAFTEAVQRYDKNRGPFLNFLRLVVNSRLTQYYRSSRGNEGVISVDFSSPTPEVLGAANAASEALHSSKEEKNAIAEEIEAFKEDLKAWNLTMQDLVNHSPKQKRLREAYMTSARVILENPYIHREFLDKKRLPIEKIKKLQKIPQKTLERGRIYIIGLVIILSGDYDHIRGYIDWRWRK